jgi:hypothetical protein
MVTPATSPRFSPAAQRPAEDSPGPGAVGTVGDVATGVAVGGRIGGQHLSVDVYEPPQGATRLKVTDMTQGRLKDGVPVGKPILRVDGPHGGAPRPHINVENLPKALAPLERLNHAPIPDLPTGALKAAKHLGKPLVVVGAVADAADLAQSYKADVARGDGEYSATKRAAGRVAGGWAGAAGGAVAGAAIGSVVPGLGTAIGGLVGGIIGGVGGSIGGSAAGEWVAGWF